VISPRAPKTPRPPFALLKPDDRRLSLAAAVEYLSQKPAFARLPFGEWSRILIFQAERGHALFVVDADRRVCGFLGWALAGRARAEHWLAGQSELRNEECRTGDVVIGNAWAADSGAVNRYLIESARRMFADKQAVYFKRVYSDGRMRGTRLPLRLGRASFEPDNAHRAEASHEAR
jgi:hemolysin-activating ACP:hemolysin acyltransferase